MEITKFIKSLLPSFTQDRLVEEARIIRDELEKVTLPAYENAEPLRQAKAFASAEAKDLNTIFARMCKQERGENMVGTIAQRLVKVIEFQTVLQEVFDKRFEKDVVVGGITILKANAIQAQSLITFVSRYSVKLLNYLYIVETEAVNGDNRYTKDSLSVGDVKWVKDHFVDFCTALAAVTRSRKEAQDIIANLPEIDLGGNADAVVAALNADKVDPLGMTRVSGFTRSPIFHVRMIVAEYQANRYKEMQETKRVLELRLLNLRRQVDSNPDAAIEQEINYTQSRVDRFNEKIRHAEEDLL